ncbi:MAG: D-alanyl-D-alanine carboxypeptidase [Armatimonadetes bacterium]|nr:D-alanyl-D-alanine carboxypeptidase [Armatimonadota bacterium]
MKPASLVLTILLSAAAMAGEDIRAKTLAPDDIGSLSAVIMDQKTRRVLWAKAAHTRRFPASTTKIMTGLLVAEKTSPHLIVTAPEGIEEVGESSLHLKSGEQLEAQDMLYAIMLRSANDACATMAFQIAGSTEGFAKLMNQRAKELGCKETQFTNPHGLHDPEHYTTAYDLGLIASAALENQRFAEVVQTWRHKVTRSSDSKDLTLTNHNKLLKEDKECLGVKTGWTVPAGKCFVGAFTVNGHTIVTVVMGGKDWMTDTTTLEGWAEANLVDKVVAGAGQALGSAPVVDGQSGEVAVRATKGLVVPWIAGTPFSATPSSTPKSVNAPVQEGQAMGTVMMKLSDGSMVPVEVEAAAAVAIKPPAQRLPQPSTLLIGGALVGGWAWMRRGRYQRRRNRIVSW